ncbi:MAG: M48 family metalloprotease [Burkholderiales bacterium]|nr:M48 family metalloprotease [Burkholderiales bacterium]
MTPRQILGLMAAAALAAVAAGANAQFRIPGIDVNRALDTVKNVVTVVNEPDEKQEREIGAEWAAILVGAAPLWANPGAQRYVNVVGRWVALHSERPDLDWQFGILDSDNVNAFATPGGYIFVTKGLVVRMRSEAELAGVLGHEIAHVVRKHHLKAMQTGALANIGGNVLTEVVGRRSGVPAELRSQLVNAGKQMFMRGLDKDDEYEADRMGVVLAARAGYDPYGLPAVLQTIAAMGAQSSELALLFETHPPPGARLDALERVMSPPLDRYATQPQVAERFVRSISGQ